MWQNMYAIPRIPGFRTIQNEKADVVQSQIMILTYYVVQLNVAANKLYF